ncbi:unnamed protein product [Pedinophyceae sp. YPF-701]|nr:unnamed protein product [Pedinophyceae sp. YPF-701]
MTKPGDGPGPAREEPPTPPPQAPQSAAAVVSPPGLSLAVAVRSAMDCARTTPYPVLESLPVGTDVVVLAMVPRNSPLVCGEPVGVTAEVALCYDGYARVYYRTTDADGQRVVECDRPSMSCVAHAGLSDESHPPVTWAALMDEMSVPSAFPAFQLSVGEGGPWTIQPGSWVLVEFMLRYGVRVSKWCLALALVAKEGAPGGYELIVARAPDAFDARRLSGGQVDPDRVGWDKPHGPSPGFGAALIEERVPAALSDVTDVRAPTDGMAPVVGFDDWLPITVAFDLAAGVRRLVVDDLQDPRPRWWVGLKMLDMGPKTQ